MRGNGKDNMDWRGSMHKSLKQKRMLGVWEIASNFVYIRLEREVRKKRKENKTDPRRALNINRLDLS